MKSDEIISFIKRERERQTLSRYEIAKRAKISPLSVKNLEERGVIPRLDTVISVLESMGYQLSIEKISNNE